VILRGPAAPGFVAKIYHHPTPARFPKIEAMIANPPHDPMGGKGGGHTSFAWPVDLLCTADRRREPVGFLMPEVAWTESLAEISNPRDRLRTRPAFHWGALHRVARNLASAMGALHERGYVIGDVNESNVLVTREALVTTVDTDSFQVPDARTKAIYRCTVGREPFIPPELQDSDLSQLDRSPEHDLFGLGVLLFQLLMEGNHPFSGVPRGSEDPLPLGGRIRAGQFPYGFGAKTSDPPPLAPPFALTDPEVQALFRRCFEDGHRNPQLRPDAHAWQSALERAEASLTICASHPQHHYGKHLRTCPWCERTALLGGRDPFPNKAEAQRRRPRPAAPMPPPAPSSGTVPAAAPTTSSRTSRKRFWIAALALIVAAEISLVLLTRPKAPVQKKLHTADSTPAAYKAPAAAAQANRRGLELRRGRRWAAAAVAFRRAVELDDRYSEAWNNLATTMVSVGDLDAAEAAANRALALPAGEFARAISLYQLARVAELRGHLEKADSLYRESLAVQQIDAP